METFVIDDTKYQTNLTTKYKQREKFKPVNNKKVDAFIPGTIREIYHSEGDKVKQNEPILILEAMKMRNIVKAPIDGKIKSIKVVSEESVAKSQPLFELY